MISGYRISAMSLNWNNPAGDAFVPWLDEVSALGFDGISGFARDGLGEYLTKPRELAVLLDERGLSIASVDIDLDVQPEDDCGRVLDRIAAAGANCVVVLGGWTHVPNTIVNTLDSVAARLDRVGRRAHSLGLSTCFHHHTNSVVETMTQTAQLLAKTDPNSVGAMVDTGHATKDFIELDIAERAPAAIKAWSSRLSLIELKDWHPEFELSVPVGEGSCDFHAVFAAMKAAQYRGWLVWEMNGPSKGRPVRDTAQITLNRIRQELTQ